MIRADLTITRLCEKCCNNITIPYLVALNVDLQMGSPVQRIIFIPQHRIYVQCQYRQG